MSNYNVLWILIEEGISCDNIYVELFTNSGLKKKIKYGIILRTNLQGFKYSVTCPYSFSYWYPLEKKL